MFFVTPDEIRRLLNGLTPQQKEVILAEQIADLPAESKARILGFSDSSLTLVTGSFVPLNSEVAVNIKNTSAGFEPETVFQALADFFRKSEMEKNKE